jgi:hypothetical protein
MAAPGVAQATYAAVIRDEVTVDRQLVESRLMFGESVQRGNEIIAADRCNASLRDACDAEIERVRRVIAEIEGAKIRTVVRATSDEGVQSTLAITIGGHSIATTPQHAIGDAADLRLWIRAVSSDPPPPNRPIVWHNGSAAVLLHEAAGHAAEHAHAPIEWPAWLRVRDGASDLLAGEAPRTMRRATFRDIPMPRMMSVDVEQEGAPFVLPADHIDVFLVRGGSYEPLTETVTIDVALPRFTIRATRAAIARSIVGARGDSMRYPGVICSREGQELFVASHAPLMITAGLS